jgi:hypothetical protein
MATMATTINTTSSCLIVSSSWLEAFYPASSSVTAMLRSVYR